MCVLLPRTQNSPLDQDPMCFEAHEVVNCTLCPDGRTFGGISGTCMTAGVTLEEMEVTPSADANLVMTPSVEANTKISVVAFTIAV